MLDIGNNPILPELFNDLGGLDSLLLEDAIEIDQKVYDIKKKKKKKNLKILSFQAFKKSL
ncbi:MAG: hypothetical protein ACTSQU_13535 [Promethearchaeota archaeon]